MADGTIFALRERRNALAKEARNLVDQNPGANWKAEHTTKFDELTAEIERIDGEVQRTQKAMDLDADRQFKEMGGRETGIEGLTPGKALNKWLRYGDANMSAEDWKTASPIMTPRDGGFQIVKNTMSGQPGNGSQGGYTVETDIVASVLDALKAYGGMRQVSTIINTAQGNPMSYPTSDGTAEVGELVAENAAASSLDPSFGTIGLNVYKFSSKIVTVPFELLQDSAVDVEAFITKRLGTRLGRITNTYFTTGTGSSQPNGVVTAAGSGKVGTTGQTGTVIYDDLVDMEHSVDPAYRQLNNTRWMMADSSLKVIRKLKDSQQRPIFLPGYYDNGIAGGIPDTILGRPYTINQDVAAMAANAKSILFGDFSFYTIRDVMALTVFRFTDSAYTKNGQVGFLAWMRSGGNLIDVGGAVKYYQNSAT